MDPEIPQILGQNICNCNQIPPGYYEVSYENKCQVCNGVIPISCEDKKGTDQTETPDNPVSIESVTLIPELQEGKNILVSFKEFLKRFPNTIHEFYTCSKAYGDYIKDLDPNDTYSHVDYPKHAPHLAYIYPIRAWKESVARNSYLKELSELSREERFILEEKALELQRKFKERDTMITFYMNIVRKRAPALYNRLNSSEKKLKEFTTAFLNGIGKKEVLEAFDIDEDAIEIFKALPTPSHEENSILDMFEEIKKNQEETHKISMKDAIVSNY